MRRALAALLIALVAGCGGKKPVAPENPHLARAKAFYADGARLLADRRFAAAARAFGYAEHEAALADDPRWIAQARFGRGVALLRAGEMAEAEKALAAAQQWARLAGVRALSVRASAFVALARARQAKPLPRLALTASDPADAWLAWADALRLAGRLDEAREAYLKAARKKAPEPVRAEALLGMARLADAQGDAESARQLAEQARALRAALPIVHAEAAMLISKHAQGARAAEEAARAWRLYRALGLAAKAETARARLRALAEAGVKEAQIWLEQEDAGD